MLVMLEASLKYMGAFLFDLTVVGVCCRIAWRMGWVMNMGMSVSGMLVDHLVCLLARRSRPYVAGLNVGRVMVNKYGHVLSLEGVTWVVLVMGSSSYSCCTGYVEFS